MKEQLDFSRVFARRMRYLVIIIGLIVSLTLPLTYLGMNLREQHQQAQLRVELLAGSVTEDVKKNPDFWYYDAPKYFKLVDNLHPEEGIYSIRIYDRDVSLLYQYDIREKPLLNFAVHAPIIYNNENYGYLEFVYDLTGIISQSIALLFFFILLGFILSQVTYSYPVSYVNKAEREVSTVLQELQNANKKLEILSVTDGKTGAYNASYLVQRIHHELCGMMNSTDPLSLLMIDIDFFKRYNDLHGHLEGDKVLSLIALLITQNVRPTDIVGRFGGEEFMVILLNTECIEAIEIANRIRAAIENYAFDGEESQPFGKLTISIGATSYGEGLTPEQLISNADKALYAAKESGRNQVCISGAEGILTSSGLPLMRMSDIVFSSDRVDTLLVQLESAFTQQIPTVHVAVIQGFLRALESRESNTASHSLLVNKIAMRIGRSIGLKDKELVQLNWGSLLHDIGKLAIGDAILLKNGPLSNLEYETVKTHPLIGYEMLKNNDYLDTAVKIILYHHERWDGKGYPYGLKGTEIPYLARICSVSDAVAAMSEDRPYCKALSEEEIRAELTGHAGSQFDPAVVQSYLDLDMYQGEPERLGYPS